MGRPALGRRTGTAAFAAAVLLAAPVMGCGVAGQEAVEAAADAFARQWAGGDLEQIGDALHADGVRVSLLGERANLVSVRQALAGLREFHAGHEPGGATVARVAEVGGVPLRAFAEISWAASAVGTSERSEYLIFVGFMREDEAWRITEIRVFP